MGVMVPSSITKCYQCYSFFAHLKPWSTGFLFRCQAFCRQCLKVQASFICVIDLLWKIISLRYKIFKLNLRYFCAPMWVEESYSLVIVNRQIPCRSFQRSNHPVLALNDWSPFKSLFKCKTFSCTIGPLKGVPISPSCVNQTKSALSTLS